MTTYTTTANADPHTITVVDDPDLVSITITETGVTLNLDPVEFTAAVTSVAGQIGAVTLDTDDVTEGSNLYHTTARTQAVIDTNTAGFISDYTVTQSDVTGHQAALSITESQISDLQSYITDYTVTESDVTGHQAALTITESQISDLDKYTDADFDTRLGSKTTANLTEGSNLYYTNARADARVNLQTGANLDLSSKSTANLSEGSNLYYTDARANSAIDTRVTGSFIDALDTVSDGGTY